MVVGRRAVRHKTRRQLVQRGGHRRPSVDDEVRPQHAVEDGGVEWRQPGYSMCLAMNSYKLGPGEHCASTSNRNFEGRQGFGGRTHLVSPAMAAAAAIAGHFVDVRSFEAVANGGAES